MAIPLLAIAAGLSQFAPMLVKYLAGDKAGEAAQEIVNVATQVTGAATPEDALKQIGASADMQLKFREKCIELEVHLAEIYLKDRADARAREVEIVRATGKKDYNLYVLAWTVIILFYALVAVLCFRVVPDANLGPVNQLFGAMAAGFGMVLAYFFGSSRGSDEKTKLLSNGGK